MKCGMTQEKRLSEGRLTVHPKVVIHFNAHPTQKLREDETTPPKQML
jgi:hypothetical protein